MQNHPQFYSEKKDKQEIGGRDGQRKQEKGGRREKRNINEKSQEGNQEGRKDSDQGKYNHFKIFIINKRACIAIAFLETPTSLRNFQKYQGSEIFCLLFPNQTAKNINFSLLDHSKNVITDIILQDSY